MSIVVGPATLFNHGLCANNRAPPQHVVRSLVSKSRGLIRVINQSRCNEITYAGPLFRESDTAGVNVSRQGIGIGHGGLIRIP